MEGTKDQPPELPNNKTIINTNTNKKNKLMVENIEDIIKIFTNKFIDINIQNFDNYLLGEDKNVNPDINDGIDNEIKGVGDEIEKLQGDLAILKKSFEKKISENIEAQKLLDDNGEFKNIDKINNIKTDFDERLENGSIKPEKIEETIHKTHLINLIFVIILFINFYYFYFYSNVRIYNIQDFNKNKSESIDDFNKDLSNNLNNFTLQSYILYNIFLIFITLYTFYSKPALLTKYPSFILQFVIYNFLIFIVILFINLTICKTYINTFQSKYINNIDKLTYTSYIELTSHYTNIYYSILIIILLFFSLHLFQLPIQIYNIRYINLVPYIAMFLYSLIYLYLSNIIGAILVTFIIMFYTIYIVFDKSYKPLSILEKLFKLPSLMFILISFTIFYSYFYVNNSNANNLLSQIINFINNLSEENKNYKSDLYNNFNFNIGHIIYSLLTFNINEFFSFII